LDAVSREITIWATGGIFSFDNSQEVYLYRR